MERDAHCHFRPLPALRYLFIHLTAIAALLCAGCYSPGRSGITADFAPVGETERANFGRMALMLPDRHPSFAFRYPHNKTEAMVHYAESTWKDMDNDDGIGDFLTGLAFSGTVGLVSGAIAGVSQQDIEEAERRMRAVLQENPIVTSLSNRIQTCLIELGHSPLPVVPPELATPLSEIAPEQRDYCALSSLGFDSVMEVTVEHHGFRSNEGGNQPLTMEATVYLQITRVSDRTVLFQTPLHYHGHQHRYMCWASEDARRFKSEVRRIARMMGRGLVDHVVAPVHAGLK